MKFRVVHPYPVNYNQNQDIISRFKDYVPPEYTDIEPQYSIPIIGDIDVEKVLKKQRLEKSQASEAPNKAQMSSNNNFKPASEVDEPLTRHIELEKLLPQNRQECKTTIALQGCPILKRNAFEKVLNLIVSTLPIKSLFVWSELPGSELADSITIFIRFSSIQLAEAFCGVLPKFEKAFSVLLSAALKPSAPNTEEDKVKEAIKQISEIITNKSNHGSNLERTGTEDLDKVMQHYSTYKVDNADLVDIPIDMKEKVVKEVIRFRSRVLNIEKEARKKEFESERRKAKAKLSSVFQNIKQSGASADTPLGTDIDMEENEEELELDKLTEEEYLASIKDESMKKEEAIYNRKLQKLQRLENQELTSLLQQLKSAEEYEESLIDNKFSYMEDFKAFSDLENPKINPILSRKLQLYYNDHAEYLRVRIAERTREEELDKADAQDELEKSEKINVEVAMMPDANQADLVNDSDVKVLELPETCLTDLRRKIEDLIEEYLGIKEEVLISFVFDYLNEHNLAKKEALVTELQETLDEDSKVVVDELYKFIVSAYKTQVSKTS